MRFTKCLLLLLSVTFILDLAGPLADSFNLFIGLLLLYILFFSVAPIGIKSLRNPIYIAGFGLTIVSSYFLTHELSLRGFALAIFVAGCAVARKARRESTTHITALTMALTILAVFFYLNSASAVVWYASDAIAHGASRLAGTLLPQLPSLGETFGGNHIILLFLLFAVSSRIAFGMRKPASYLYPLAWILGTWLIYAAYISFLPDLYDFATRRIIHYPYRSYTPQGKTVINYIFLGSPLILFALLTPSIRFMTAPNSKLPCEKTEISKQMWGAFILKCLAVMVLGACGFLLLSHRDVRPNARMGDIVFYEKGFLNWLEPKHGDYGEYSTGMFGQLPKHIRALGFRSLRVSGIDDDALRNASALVLINIDHEIPRDTLETVWRFVQNGGTLLVLGDHTFRTPPGINHINTCLEPFEIRFNFDSAQFFIGGWLNSYRLMQHPLTYGIQDDRNQLGIVVGASLSIKPPATPIIIGTYGFSDSGDAKADTLGYLGNLMYDFGEPLGDQVLVASQNYGRGRILVFGDTSSFTNPISIWSFPFIKRVLAWLQAHSNEGIRWGNEFLALLSIIASLVLIGTLPKPALGFLCLIPGIVAATVLNDRQSEKLDLSPSGHIAYIDFSHVEQSPLEGWREKGTMGLHLNLQREGYLSYVLTEFKRDFIEKSELLVMIAPSKEFSKDEIRFLEAYVAKGGKLLLCIGYEERTASLALLSSLGLKIEDTPLGNFSISFNDTLDVKFVEAWPVNDTTHRGEIIASYEDYPIIVYKRIGSGGVMLIGDSQFFINENLEHDNHPHLDMIEFLRYLLNRYLKNDLESDY